MQGIQTHIPETNHVSRGYIVAYYYYYYYYYYYSLQVRPKVGVNPSGSIWYRISEDRGV